ncbi:MAG: flagellar hook-length control protein FliK [Hyphomicrobiaceae bacterium]|nr:flagellar hook-length control protein FliK [Hyphomicrobiaceae bacterium]
MSAQATPDPEAAPSNAAPATVDTTSRSAPAVQSATAPQAANAPPRSAAVTEPTAAAAPVATEATAPASDTAKDTPDDEPALAIDDRPAATRHPAHRHTHAAGVMTAALAFAERLRAETAAETVSGEPTLAAIAAPAAMPDAEAPATPAATVNSRADAPQVTVPELGAEIARQAKASGRSFEIRLDPPDLGKVQVKLDVSEAGEVRAHLIVERKDTLDLMLADRRNLEKTLEQAGFRADQADLQFSLRQDGSGAQGQFSREAWKSYGTERRADIAPPVVDTEMEVAAAALAGRRPGGVDLRV